MAKKFDQQLVQRVSADNGPNGTWTWTPLWAEASQTTIPDSATYTYVPLQPQVPEQPYVVTLVGVRKYLLIKQSSRGTSFSAATYFFKEKENATFSQANVRAFFSTYTGMLMVKNFATAEVLDFAYQHGARQPYPATAQASGKTSNRTSSCYTTVTCYWSGTCQTEPNGGNATYGTTTYGIGGCTSPGDDGVGCSRISWSLTSSNTELHCSPDGPGDPGPGPGGGGGTGGGTQTPPTPCQHMNTLGAQPVFSQAVNTLIGKTGLNYESGYTYSNGGRNGSDYTAVDGLANADQIIYPNPSMPLDGIMHTHPPGTFSVFSMTDLASMYRTYHLNQMMDPSTFTITVFTDSGVDYAIKITNLNDFLDFGNISLFDDDAVRDFESTWYNSAPGHYDIDATKSIASNEQSFLRLLKERNTGLTMFKHDRTQNTWQQLGLDTNNSPIVVPCP